MFFRKKWTSILFPGKQVPVEAARCGQHVHSLSVLSFSHLFVALLQSNEDLGSAAVGVLFLVVLRSRQSFHVTLAAPAMIVGQTGDHQPEAEPQPDKGRSVFHHLAQQTGRGGSFKRLAPLPTRFRGRFLTTNRYARSSVPNVDSGLIYLHRPQQLIDC